LKRCYTLPYSALRCAVHARVLALAGGGAELLVENERIAAAQFARCADADQAQVGSQGRADVGQLLERLAG